MKMDSNMSHMHIKVSQKEKKKNGDFMGYTFKTNKSQLDTLARISFHIYKFWLSMKI